MQKYELTIVLPAGTTAAKKKEVTKNIESLVKINNGKLGKSDDWGEKDLAYKIGKNSKGLLVYYELELDAENANSVKEKLNLEEDFLRYLMVRS